MIEETHKNIQEDKIDVTKNSRGYNWTMTFYKKDNVTDAELLKRFVEWDNMLRDKFALGMQVKEDDGL